MLNKSEQLVHHSTPQQANSDNSSYRKLHLTQPTYLSESVCPVSPPPKLLSYFLHTVQPALLLDSAAAASL